MNISSINWTLLELKVLEIQNFIAHFTRLKLMLVNNLAVGLH